MTREQLLNYFKGYAKDIEDWTDEELVAEYIGINDIHIDLIK